MKPIGLENWASEENLIERLSREFDHQINERNPDIEILVACYVYEDWSGQAIVIYRLHDELYIVEGSHCSCYGLEDQWSPQKISLDYIEHRTVEGSWFYADDKSINKEFIRALGEQGLYSGIA